MAESNSYKMMGLGDFRFCLDTAAHQELERNSAWRWPSVERIGARPALQYVGPGEDKITMRGTIYPHFRGGLGQVSAMREQAAKGLPLLMIDGTGRVWGKYVITDIREGQSTFFSNGMPRKVDFDLSLSMYDDDGAGSIVPNSPSSTTGQSSSKDSLQTSPQSNSNQGSFDSQTVYDGIASA